MTHLRGLLEIPPAAPADLPMTAGEVAALVEDDVFDVGGHTATHPLLPSLTPAERRREVAAGRAACERLAGRSIDGFAYPYGGLDADSTAAVRQCGFAWACSTVSRTVQSRDVDRYALPRLAVLNWDAPAFERALERLPA
jgi:peptidoglycan/xylan/chitin deacetylase (PgdA/CDA1 family)